MPTLSLLRDASRVGLLHWSDIDEFVQLVGCFEDLAPTDYDDVSSMCPIILVLGFVLALRCVFGLTAGRFGEWLSATSCLVLATLYVFISWLSVVELVRFVWMLYWIHKHQKPRDEARNTEQRIADTGGNRRLRLESSLYYETNEPWWHENA